MIAPAVALTTAPRIASALIASAMSTASSAWVPLASVVTLTVRSTSKPQSSSADAMTRTLYAVEFCAAVTLIVVTWATAMSAESAESAIRARTLPATMRPTAPVES